MLKSALTALTILALTTQTAWAATYQIDPVHSQIEFTVAHLVMFNVKGSFTEYEGTIEADAASKTLESAKAVIKVASIDTREPKRDNHLRSADFFDSANHPEMSFISKQIQGSGRDITVRGNLTIRGTTKEVTLKGRFLGENTDPWGNVRTGFTASTVINRHDFGLNWNKALETGGLVVGDDVTITLDIQGVRQK